MATQGGGLDVGQSSDFSFRVTLDMGTTGTISNQGSITAAGARGAPVATTLTDGNADGPGNPPTDITTGSCTADAQCKGATPICDPTTGTCVGCTMDSQCTGAEKKCDVATNTCVCAGAPKSCIDTDKDGLSDSDEGTIGTDPNDADTDDDGVRDGKEPMPGVDTDRDGKINVLDPDSDDDGLFDGTEEGYGCDDAATDKADRHCVADADMGKTTTNPIVADTDGGGVSDGKEDKNQNGAIDADETDPKLACDDKGVLFCDQRAKSLTGGPGGCSVSAGEQGFGGAGGLLGLLALGSLLALRTRRTAGRRERALPHRG
jgi:MYXO-CTERM domain-containing protein